MEKYIKNAIYSRNIKYLLKCSETLNISKAAREMHISQSTISLALQQLEEDIGFSVFTRNKGKGSLRLTAKAETLVEELKTQGDSLEKVFQQISGQTEALKIASVPYFASKFLLPSLKASKLLQECNVFHVRGGTAKDAVMGDKVDLAFISSKTRPMRSAKRCIEIKEEEVAIVGLREKFPHLDKIKSVEELTDEPWVVGDRPRDDWFDALKGKTEHYWVYDHYSAKMLVMGGYALAPFQLDYLTDKELKKLAVSKIKIPSTGIKLFAVISKNVSEEKMKMVNKIIQQVKKLAKS